MSFCHLIGVFFSGMYKLLFLMISGTIILGKPFVCTIRKMFANLLPLHLATIKATGRIVVEVESCRLGLLFQGTYLVLVYAGRVAAVVA